MIKKSILINDKEKDIVSIIKTMNKVNSSSDVNVFYNFAKDYGPNNICHILNYKGVDIDGITCSGKFDVVDKISNHIFNRVSDRKFVNAHLGSPYYYTKYTYKQKTKQFEENKLLLSYNVLVDNKKVDVKRKYSAYDIKKLAEKRDVILLGIKQTLLDGKTEFFEDLCPVATNFFSRSGAGNLIDFVFPSIKFADNQAIMNNMKMFEEEYPFIKSEVLTATKQIAKKVLTYEVEKEQVNLKKMFEHSKNKLVKYAKQCEEQLADWQKQIELNEKLLSCLEKISGSTEIDFDFNV